MNFTKINPEEISENAIKLIGKDWMLITGGNTESNNCMTASWGGIGFLWNKPVVYIFVRPQRYTNEFLETANYFTLSFFDNSYREMLNFCGKQSGKIYNKAKEGNLSLFETSNGAVAYNEAKLIIECKKIYAEQIKKEAFTDMNPYIIILKMIFT